MDINSGNIYRIHIRPSGGEGNAEFSFEYCLKNQVLGMGWNIGDLEVNWEDYSKRSSEIYEGSRGLTNVKYLKENIKPNDIIWTRNDKGSYYIGKVLSKWEYLYNESARKADIVNIIRCNLIEVASIDEVPGKVIACFRPSRTLQAIKSETINTYTKFLWNKYSKKEEYSIENLSKRKIFDLLDSEEIEDIIFIYLQLQGWVVIPNSRKVDTMSYEYYLINKVSKERAIVQIKSGGTLLNSEDWKNWKERVILFQAEGHYINEPTDNIDFIKPSEIEEFMNENKEILPASIQNWMDIIK